jgi:alpha-amylase
VKKTSLIAQALVLMIAISGCSANESKSDVGIQLFMFNWNSVAVECEQSLGPAGLSWALVSPPQEHINQGQWWVHYQPVSYRIESRLGSREEFKEMVSRCNRVGVEIITDAVINHMAGSSYGTGWAGSEYEKYDYPGIYTAENFHNCGLSENNQISNYADRAQVQTCELLGLSDLDTGSKFVQERIIAYLKDLISLGVAGFRIDAAKHMAAEDLAEIIAALPTGTRIMHEVIRGGGEGVQPEEYLSTGQLWEFSFSRLMTSFGVESVPNLDESTDLGYFIESEKAISFVTNHDTERNGNAITPISDPVTFKLASIFMLASDYGTPMLYSGYPFSDYDQAPPLGAQGEVLDVTCGGSGGWNCQQRDQSIIQMIKWRTKTMKLPTADFLHTDSYSAWSKGELGFFAINAAETELSMSFQTSLPQGLYCNTLLLNEDQTSCPGNEIQVGQDGLVQLNLAPQSAVALIRN